MLFALFEELRVRLLGGTLLISRAGIKMMRARLTVSSARAERELGVRFRPFEETLRDTTQWYLEHGFLKSPPAAQHRAMPSRYLETP